ncbi:hypothetical protein [Comamonas sp. GB3 AK4-5]|uniref:hypothetical protein n=1 Tax=Comamonas sp. GB3 AK4-5 TaxID=3231487 RepID=UPI00351DB116
MTFAFAARPGFSILSRLLAAVLGGYALASAVAVLLAAALPIPRAEAVLAGMQWSFVAHVVVAIWAFSPVSQARMWGWLLGLSAAILAAAWALGG